MELTTKDKDARILHFYHVEKMSIRETSKAVPCSTGYIKKVLSSSGGPGIRDNKAALALRSTDVYKEKIRQTKIGESNHRAKLTAIDVIQIREDYAVLLRSMNKTQAQHILAKEYSVKRPTISDIVLFRTWKHIEKERP